MKDFSQMSDEELDRAIIERESAKPIGTNLEDLSDDELDNMLAEKLAAEAAGPEDRRGQAFAEGFGNAASFGYLPQLQAATEPYIQKAIDFVVGDENVEPMPEESYVDRRDRFIRRGQDLAAENPWSYGAGAVGGAISSGIATGGGLNQLIGKTTRFAPMVNRLADAGRAGATIGVIRNPGDKEGEVDPLQLEERAINAGKDALTGVVVQGGLEALAKGGKAVLGAGKKLKSYSQTKALKAAGYQKQDYVKAFGKKKAAELGQTAIDEGLVELGDDIASTAKKTEAKLYEAGSRIGKIYDKADNATSLSGADIRGLNDDFINESAKRLKGTIRGEEVSNKVENVLEIIRDNKNPTFGDLRKLRSSIDDEINFSKKSNELPLYQEELLHLRNKIQDLVKDKIGKVNPALKKDLIKENRRFSQLSDLAKVSEKKLAGENANAAFGLRERMSGGTGAVVGGVVGGGVPGAIAGGIAGTITTKLARQYGTPFVAMTANKVAKALDANNPAIQRFAKPLIESANNPEKFVAAVNLLMKKPEFMKAVQESEQGSYYRGPAKK